MPSGKFLGGAGAKIFAHGIDLVQADFARRAATTEARVRKATAHAGMMLQTRIQAKASGRPGPNVITGDYRRSWNVQMTSWNGAPAAVVGTAKPQGPRLEYGFVGTDSLGRTYNQPPYPHVRPASDEIAREYEENIVRIVS